MNKLFCSWLIKFYKNEKIDFDQQRSLSGKKLVKKCFNFLVSDTDEDDGLSRPK